MKQLHGKIGCEAKKNLKARLVSWNSKQVRSELSRHYDPYWQGLHVTAHETFANLLRDIADDEIKINLHPDQDRDATRICFALNDHPGIFSRLAGALALVGANVVDAEHIHQRMDMQRLHFGFRISMEIHIRLLI